MRQQPIVKPLKTPSSPLNQALVQTGVLEATQPQLIGTAGELVYQFTSASARALVKPSVSSNVLHPARKCNGPFEDANQPKFDAPATRHHAIE